MNEGTLVQRLAALPGRIDPPADLWPAIEAGIEGRETAPDPVRRRRLAAAAAAVLVVVGLVSLEGRRHDAPSAPDAAPPVAASLPRAGQVLATGIERDYSGALRLLARQMPPPARTLDTGEMELGLRTLEHAAEEIRAAIATDPDAVYLAGLLESTHRMRLRMLRDLAMNSAWSDEYRRMDS